MVPISAPFPLIRPLTQTLTVMAWFIVRFMVAVRLVMAVVIGIPRRELIATIVGAMLAVVAFFSGAFGGFGEIGR